MNKIIKSLVIALAISLATPCFSAGISGLLDGMYSNVTNPVNIDGQLRDTFSGPSAYARLPITSIQPIAFDPPRFSAGCGGIDMYMGSFSFITSDNLTKFIRNVAQNAAPLAFKMAIEAAFPQLSGILADFQRIAQQMNDLNKNSCQVATGLVSAIGNATGLTQYADEKAAQMATEKTWLSDRADEMAQLNTYVNGLLQPSSKVKNPDGTQADESGNSTWQAIKAVVAKNAVLGVSDDDPTGGPMSALIIFSLMGGPVVTPGDPNDPKSDKLPSAIPTHGPLHLKDLFNPQAKSELNGALGISLLRCDEPNECAVVSGPTTVNFDGIKGYVTKMMLGSTTATTIDPNGNSIVQKLIAKGNGNTKITFTAQQNAFLNATSKYPTMGVLKGLQKSEGRSLQLALQMIDILTVEFSVEYGRTVIAAIDTIWATHKGSKPDGYRTIMADMNAELRDASRMSNASLDKFVKAVEFADLVKNNIYNIKKTEGGLK